MMSSIRGPAEPTQRIAGHVSNYEKLYQVYRSLCPQLWPIFDAVEEPV